MFGRYHLINRIVRYFFGPRGTLKSHQLTLTGALSWGIWEQKADTVLRLTKEAETNPEHA